MDVAAAISITGTFVQYVGDAVADLKRRELSQIDIELLRLKQTQLTEKLEDLKRDLLRAVQNEKARAEQDLISRGLSNTSIRDSKLRSIDEDANTQLDRAMREYNRAIEEIAIMERRLKTEARLPIWKRFIHKIIGS